MILPMIRPYEHRWLTNAVNLAEMSTHPQWKVAAILVKGGRVLSMGVNRYRNSPAKVGLEGVSYHAEEVALKRAGDASGATIYVARVTRSGYLGLAKPCEKCQELLETHGVRRAVWTTQHGYGKQRIESMSIFR